MSNLSIIQFGGTGDLAKRKLLPAYKALRREGQEFDLLCLGRKYDNKSEYLKNMVDNSTDYDFVDYLQYDLSDSPSQITDYLKAKKSEQIVFYLALGPDLYKLAIKQIQEILTGLKKNIDKKIIIEKPFGFDVKTSRKYNQIILKIFEEKEVYRVDHYLGKEFIQNLLLMRFDNDLIQSIWNKNFIESVKIEVDEKQGVDNRINSYEKMGVIRDMIQNHILQIITHLTMAEPVKYEQKYISQEKIKILKSIRKIKSDDFKLGYYQSLGKKLGKKTATYVNLKLFVDNFDFAQVPFYIRTGKKLGKSKSVIYVKFKSFRSKTEDSRVVGANAMVIQIQPEMKIDFVLNIKKPFKNWQTSQTKLAWDHRQSFKINSPEAYEQILKSAINSDKSIFPCFGEIEESWKVVAPMLKSKKEIKAYEDGSVPE